MSFVKHCTTSCRVNAHVDLCARIVYVLQPQALWLLRAAQLAVTVHPSSFVGIGFASQEVVLSGDDSFMVFQTADCVVSRTGSSARIALRWPGVVGRSFKNETQLLTSFFLTFFTSAHSLLPSSLLPYSFVVCLPSCTQRRHLLLKAPVYYCFLVWVHFASVSTFPSICSILSASPAVRSFLLLSGSPWGDPAWLTGC